MPLPSIVRGANRNLFTALATALALIAMTGAPRSAHATDAAAPAAESDPQYEHLVHARELFQTEAWQRAIDEHLNPVIGYYEHAYKDSDQALYSADGLTQSLLYTALPQDGKQGVTVLDSTWADAYLLKAYALGELHDIDGAIAAMRSALTLSPMSASYTCELAYLHQSKKDFGRALDLYRQAAEYAELASDEAHRNEDLGRAWRGQAFLLIERGKLEEAKKLLKKCLKLDRNDAKAKNELEYIEQLEKKASGR